MISSVGIILPDIWKNKSHVPNHQPVNVSSLWLFFAEWHGTTTWVIGHHIGFPTTWHLFKAAQHYNNLVVSPITRIQSPPLWSNICPCKLRLEYHLPCTAAHSSNQSWITRVPQTTWALISSRKRKSSGRSLTWYWSQKTSLPPHPDKEVQSLKWFEFTYSGYFNPFQ